ncbi:hypothetical protein V8D89_002911 [Ganoderma adspersum]
MGLDALRRLTNQIVIEVQTLASASPPPGNNYTDLLHSLRTAFEQGIAILGGLFNAAAPIHRMPPELLANIFALSPKAITHGNGQHQLAYWPLKLKAEDDVADLHRLTKVCRYWRDLAIATPTLWTTIGTLLSSNNSSDHFRQSKYLPENSSLDLVIHFDASSNRTEKMIDFMLKKAPNIRELHAWGLACIPDVPSFLLSFDADALEHCTLWRWPNVYWGSDFDPPHAEPLPETQFLRFFSNGGSRLRSLYLTDFDGLPTNRFPVLTLLVIASVESESRTTMEALLKFLAGCPRLEEVYIYNIEQCSSQISPRSSPPISLPHLQYLYYAHGRRRVSLWEEDMDPLEYLLSHTSIPATCHIHFIGDDQERRASNGHILDSVCRHVQGKDVVSHLLLWLLPDSESDETCGPSQSSLQLVFSQGSLRLQFPTQFDCVDILRSFPRLFSTTKDIRIRYDTAVGRYADLKRSLAMLLPATFPSLKVLSLIPEDHMWTDPTIRPLHQYLAEPPRSDSASGSSPTPDNADLSSLPHPPLDTLWIFVQSDEAITALETTLAARAALGFPIRRVIVHHCFLAGSTALARLQALDAEEVILTKSRASSMLRERDWAVGFPDMFSLPAAIRRDWPTVWYRNDMEDRDGRQEDSSEEEQGGTNDDFDWDR